MCDFWARVKLRKKPIDELVQDALENINDCDGQNATALDDAIEKYWSIFGVRSMSRLCKEEPDLCDKMKLVEQQVRSRLV
jgi:hypothetical protein